MFQVRCLPPCTDGLACPGSHRSLANGTGATIKGVVAKFQNCSSKLCSAFGTFESRSLQQRRLQKQFNFGTATSYHELRVLNRDCAAQNCEAAKLYVATSLAKGIQVCVGEDLSLLIVDLKYHGQWHLFQVRCLPPCTDGLACPGSHRSLANGTGATIKGVVAKFQNCSSKLCSAFSRFESRSLQQRRLQKHFNFGTATSYHELRVLNRDCAAQNSEAAKL